jgi:flagellin
LNHTGLKTSTKLIGPEPSHTVDNLTNISVNQSAAQGAIEDAGFARETTQLAKNQILQQFYTAMLAQANVAKQQVLSVLQG